MLREGFAMTLELFLGFYYKFYGVFLCSKETAAARNNFRDIGLLEELVENKSLPQELAAELEKFLLFCKRKRTSRIKCRCGRVFEVSKISDALPLHSDADGFFCVHSGCLGIEA